MPFLCNQLVSVRNRASLKDHIHICLVSFTTNKSWIPMPARLFEHFLFASAMLNEFVVFICLSFKLLPRLEKKSNYR